MSTTDPPRTVFRAKVTGRHTITLPAELRRQLEIADGDTVELELDGDQAVIRKQPSEPVPALRGLLRDYFRDWEDINQFIAEERQGWEERMVRLEDQRDRGERSRQHSDTSTG